MKFKTRLIEKINVANGTTAFKWEKPEGFEFKSGQTIDWSQIDPKLTDAEGSKRTFSIIASPFEDYVGFATRMRDTAFKNNLREYQLDQEIEAEGPFGSFTLQNNTQRPAVFLTGGIGITPVYSIIKQATHDKSAHKIILFYSNHTADDAAFMDELNELAAQNQNFTFVPVMTQQPDWPGQKGRISTELLTSFIDDLNKPIYYLCGPAAMVESMRKILIDSKVDEDNIRSEDFPGY